MKIPQYLNSWVEPEAGHLFLTIFHPCAENGGFQKCARSLSLLKNHTGPESRATLFFVWSNMVQPCNHIKATITDSPSAFLVTFVWVVLRSLQALWEFNDHMERTNAAKLVDAEVGLIFVFDVWGRGESKKGWPLK